jgi:FkbM family methyltransferase
MVTTINGVLLDLDFECISEALRSRILGGRYERRETEILPRLIEENESVLELGGGIGYVSSLIYKTGKCRNLAVVEAHPGLMPVIERNHELNNVTATVIHGVAVASAAKGEANFYLHEHFWTSSTHAPVGGARQERIKAVDVCELLERLAVSFLICDIEGGEDGLFENLSLDGVNKVLVEQHPKVVGEHAAEKVAAALRRQNFHRCEKTSCRNFDVFFKNVLQAQ